MRYLRYTNLNDYIGLRFGRLTIIDVKKVLCEGKYKYYRYFAICKCECGEEITLDLNKLVKNTYKRGLECRKCQKAKTKYKHPLYFTLLRMKTRCYNPKYDFYDYYGGRGIKVCDEWLNSYEAFYNWAMSNGYKKGLSIDRIDVNGNYEPSNCRWATPSQQSANQRKCSLNTSGYTGILWQKNIKKWQAFIIVNKKCYNLGYYKTEKEALDVRNKYIIDNELNVYPIQKYIGEIGNKEVKGKSKPEKYCIEEYIGKKYNKLTIIEDLGRDNTCRRMVKVRCECGVEYPIRFNRVISGETKQCRHCANRKAGLNGVQCRNLPLYNVWCSIRNRCNNPKVKDYKNYGMRGIKIYEEWNKDFVSFYNWALNNGYKKGLTIDRIDVNGNYCPENCRWISHQANNVNERVLDSNKSGYTGIICHEKYKKKWYAYLGWDKKTIGLGHYFTQKEALEARNKYIIDNNLPHRIQEYKGEIGSLE